jgi:C-terminal processing protease CtpA/Prc
VWLGLAALPGVWSCGGNTADGSTSSGSSGYTAGVFPSSSQFMNLCAAPRTGRSAVTGDAFPDKPGTLQDEQAWLRSWINELYLWYREVPDQNWTSYSTAVDYFDVLKTPATTASGKPKDQFHFTYDTAQWEALSQSGVQVGYGALWVLQPNPPRSVIVGVIEPGSAAEAAGLGRGAQILTVDGAQVAFSNDVNTLNNGLFPTDVGHSHTFTVLDAGSANPRSLTMVSEAVTETPVQHVQTVAGTGGSVGYMLFDDHIATAEVGLISAINQLKGVSDLVLDIRYNGGGYLDIASELAYMIAGPATTSGRTFEKETFNDKYPTRDPVTGQPLTPTPFLSTTQGFSTTQGQPLPYLGLSRVFVLTTADTCSASEAVINGLRGVGVTVIGVGQTTCGKPYGFYPQDNCGTTYFSIEMQGVNDQGFGDYADGFVPGGTTAAALPGCAVADDLTHALGDPQEALLANALAYRAHGSCGQGQAASEARAAATGGRVVRSPWRENRIFRGR